MNAKAFGISRWTHQSILVNVPKAINGEKHRETRRQSTRAGGMINENGVRQSVGSKRKDGMPCSRLCCAA